MVDFVKWEEKSVTVTMSNEANNSEVEERLEKARCLLEAGSVKTKPFITHILELEALPTAFALLKDAPGEVIKIVITP